MFKLVPPGKKAGSWTETVLYSFGSQPGDGIYPQAGLIMDAEGNLYGTTVSGGASTNCDDGCGSVFELSATGTETVLYSFCSQGGCTDGTQPYADLIMDKKGNLDGTTGGGGTNGGGTVFQLTPNNGTWTETVLHSFGSQPGDGIYPQAGLIMDKKGNLYGTTQQGGAYGEGTVFELSPTGTETVLHSFPSQSGDGYWLDAGLIRDKKGNLYGTSYEGGANGEGAVFKVTP